MIKKENKYDLNINNSIIISFVDSVTLIRYFNQWLKIKERKKAFKQLYMVEQTKEEGQEVDG